MNFTYSFEQEPGREWLVSEGSRISISRKQKKDGISSLRWDFNGQGSLTLNAPIGYQPFKEGSISQARDSFVVWICSEEPLLTPLTFSFYKKGRLCVRFFFQMNFTGWRTAWVPYEQMEGTPETDMDRLVISACSDKPASLYLDQLILSSAIDPRHPTRDYQVPFVNLRADKAANSHWLSLYRFSCLMEASIQKEGALTVSSDSAVISQITERLETSLMKKKPFLPSVSALLEEYAAFRDKTVDAACHKDAYPDCLRAELSALTDSVDIKTCSAWMLSAAYLFRKTEDTSVKDAFIELFQHLLWQGWSFGSSLGTTHHLGYPMRPLYHALFLMRKPLKEARLLEKAASLTAWYSGLGRIFREDSEMNGESMDTLNTLLHGILEAVLLMETGPIQHHCLTALSHWLSCCMRPAPGLRGPFKADGSAFHHCNHYPAYAMGGFTGAAPVLWMLSATPYQVEKEAHAAMKKALLTMRLYSNHFNWLVSMSCRHPCGVGEMSQISSLEPFYYMALTGTPDRKEAIDSEMAGALLRLAKFRPFWGAAEIASYGYQAEASPSGHFTMNYACAALHRRDNWLAGVRGHSRYIWGDEIYVANNLYGRYITYGNLQILGNGNPVNNDDSGFHQEGFDWNCFPGTTAVHLPFDKLRANVCNVDTLSGFEEMLLSDEAFAGGTNMLEKNGIFAMKLHSHAKYDATQRARKSWFFFDNRILCLGSGIENEDSAYETRTTLFQNYLVHPHDPVYLQTPDAVTTLDYKKEICHAPVWLYDNTKNGYYIPDGQRVCLTREVQESRDQNTGAETQAPFAKAWLSHGNAPREAGYEYLVLIHPGSAEAMQSLAGAFQTALPYHICQKNNQAHIVKDLQTEILSYVLFEAAKNLSYGILESVDRPSLIMERQSGIALSLSICDPDLRLYEGVEADQLDENGLQREVSLYSRAWRKAASIGKHLTLQLRGLWKLDTPSDTVALTYGEEETSLRVWCIDAETTSLCLVPIEQ